MCKMQLLVYKDIANIEKNETCIAEKCMNSTQNGVERG